MVSSEPAAGQTLSAGSYVGDCANFGDLYTCVTQSLFFLFTSEQSSRKTSYGKKKIGELGKFHFAKDERHSCAEKN